MKNRFDRTPHTMKDWLLLAAGVAAVFAAADWLPGVLRGAGAFLGLLAPFGWGLLLAYVLDIPTRFFAQKLFGGRRGGAMAVSYALFFGALALLAALDAAGLTDRVDAIHLDDLSRLPMDYAGRFSVEMEYNADYDRMLQILEAGISKLESNQTGSIRLDLNLPILALY